MVIFQELEASHHGKEVIISLVGLRGKFHQCCGKLQKYEDIISILCSFLLMCLFPPRFCRGVVSDRVVLFLAT